MDSGLRRMGILVFLLLVTVTASDLDTDRSALLSLRSSIGRSVLSTWNASTSPCTWQGVSCESGRVTALHLPGSGLLGHIPTGTVGNLTALKTLSLRFNAISGSLPSDFPNAVSLKNLYLQQNLFSGEFPAVLYSLKNLVRLDLAGNNFTGGISSSLGNLTRLRSLFLESNGFTGPLPDIALPNLQQFNVSFNSMNGSIPVAFEKMPANAFLGMSVCGGPLPACPTVVPGGSSEKSKKLSSGAVAGIAVGSAVAVAIVLILLFLLFRKKRDPANVAVPREKPVISPVESAKKLVFFSGDGKGEFDLEDLLRASAEVLGRGTVGTVYKAVMEMGFAVAVKRLRDVNLGEREFKEKIEEVGFMDHQNLVPMRAYYYSKDEKLLVYDYMENGSLSALLHGKFSSS